MPLAAVTPQPREPIKTRPVAPGVFVVDNLLADDHRKMVLQFLQGDGWKFGWKSHGKTDQFSFWHKHFAGYRHSREEERYDCAEELQKNSPLMFNFWKYLASAFKGQTLIRCYANGQSYGSDGTVHVDSKFADSSTAVYYPHGEWHPNWAGETVIFNADKSDIVAAIYPKPNRLLVFKGNLPHVARGVSRICPELRITLMFKTGTPDDQR